MPPTKNNYKLLEDLVGECFHYLKVTCLTKNMGGQKTFPLIMVQISQEEKKILKMKMVVHLDVRVETGRDPVIKGERRTVL